MLKFKSNIKTILKRANGNPRTENDVWNKNSSYEINRRIFTVEERIREPIELNRNILN